MSFRDMPDCVVPPSHERCEAMTKATRTYQDWRRESHRCVRRAKQGRDGHAVCALHAYIEHVAYWNGEPDNFRYRRFWKWPTKLADLSRAIIGEQL